MFPKIRTCSGRGLYLEINGKFDLDSPLTPEEQILVRNPVIMFMGRLYALVDDRVWVYDESVDRMLRHPLGKLAWALDHEPDENGAGAWREIEDLPSGLRVRNDGGGLEINAEIDAEDGERDTTRVPGTTTGADDS